MSITARLQAIVAQLRGSSSTTDPMAETVGDASLLARQDIAEHCVKHSETGVAGVSPQNLR